MKRTGLYRGEPTQHEPVLEISHRPEYPCRHESGCFAKSSWHATDNRGFFGHLCHEHYQLLPANEKQNYARQ